MMITDIASEYKKVGNARGYQGYTVTCGGGPGHFRIKDTAS